MSTAAPDRAHALTLTLTHSLTYIRGTVQHIDALLRAHTGDSISCARPSASHARSAYR
jgi:hypothetical protein